MIKNVVIPYQFLIKLPVDIIGQNIVSKITNEIILYFFSPILKIINFTKINKYKMKENNTIKPPSVNH